MIQTHTFCWNPFQVNSYLLFDDSGEGWLIDSGAESEDDLAGLDDILRQKNVRLTRVLLTHGHVDHVLGCARMVERYKVFPELHPADHLLYRKAVEQGSMFGLRINNLPEVRPLEPDDLFLNDSLIRAIRLPGHSPGSMGYYIPESKILFAGDVIFKHSIGRTDIPGGDYNELINSIRNEILGKMEDETLIFPGHGPETTVGEEKLFNPFLQG
ncbi:MAG: MBL fold metallo-hydrolase [Chlorobi bacterium]|nr:MBL fold metallo-hydrolase [Chlorobiota bacterium]